MSERILITGGAGFIGSHLVAALRRESPASTIWLFDNLHPQVHGPDAPGPAPAKQVVFRKGDITDRSALSSMVREAQPQVVYHLAAETGTGQSQDELFRYCHVNVSGTANLIEAIRRESGTVTKQILLTGSRAIYGEGAYRDAAGTEFVGLPRNPEAMAQGDFSVPVPHDAKLPATPCPSHAGLAPNPASVYASTKLMQEYLLRQGGSGAAWRAVILRLQNVYGPGQSLRNPYTGVLTVFARQLLSQESLNIFEDGKIARDFVYVADVAEALLLAKGRHLPHGTILDIGTGQPATILEVAQRLIRLFGRTDQAFSITGQFRAGDIRHACADPRAANRHLGWAPRTDLDQGLRLFADWAKDVLGQAMPHDRRNRKSA